MLRRPANARPRLRRDVKVVGQNAQADARTGYPASIAPHSLRANDRCLSHNTLLPGKTVMKGALTLISNLDRLPSDHGSACLARQRERQVQLNPVVHDLGRDAAAFAAFEAD